MKTTFTVVFGFAVIWLIIALVANGKEDQPAPIPTRSSMLMQQGVWERMAPECRVEGPQIAVECLEGFTEAEIAAMRCQEEDGNSDGLPCVWFKPNAEGKWILFYNDGTPR